MDLRLGIDAHCSKLENPEAPASIADALLAKKQRAGGNEENPKAYQSHYRAPERGGQPDAGEVENALPARYPSAFGLRVAVGVTRRGNRANRLGELETGRGRRKFTGAACGNLGCLR